MKRMKIVHILTDTNIGGAGHYLKAYLAAHDRENFDVHVILPQGSLLSPAISSFSVPVHEIAHIGDRSISLRGIYEIYRTLKRLKPDIVNTHASFSGRIAAKMLRITVIHTRHYCLTSNRMGFMNNFFSDGVIATSPKVEAGLIEAGTNPKRITTIFNGVPPLRKLSEDEKSIVRNKYNIPHDAFVVIQMARLDPIKGHNYSLDAAKILADEPQIVFLFAGIGSLEEHIRKRIADEEINNVIMTGFISDVAEIVGISDLSLSASYSETTCLALLEGMSIGLPAVVSDGGGNPITVQDMERGLVVPYGDGAALAKAIFEMKNNVKLYKQLSDKALEGFEKYFRADIMAARIEELYRSKQ